MHSHSILKSTFPTPSTFPSSATELYNPPETTNECVSGVRVCRFGTSFTYVIKNIDSKLISVCLIKYYSLIGDLHKFVYGRFHFTRMYKGET